MKPKPSAALFTLGCKLNQFESVYLQEQLEKSGYRIVSFTEKADLYLVNTCTVTAKADYHSRLKLRQAHRLNPQALLVALGCSAQIDPQKLACIQGVDLILGNDEKAYLLSYLATLVKKVDCPISAVREIEKATHFKSLGLDRFRDYTRAFLKVQEGCSQSCSYCIVPKARGKSRSAPLEAILEQAGRLAANGYPELVLTGIHLGMYGLEAEPKTSLAKLLTSLIDSITSLRFRLSSIEPKEFTPELKEIVTQSPRICPHLHIPLQSGDDEILRRMRRPYSAAFYVHLIEELVSACPHLAIGADIIVGFPGESEESFQKTYALLTALPLAYLHVFSYSPRQGTEAATMPQQLDGLTKKKRGDILRQLSKEKSLAFRRRLIGQPLLGVVLGGKESPSGKITVLSENYIQIILSESHELRNDEIMNKQIKLEITQVTSNQTIGRIIP